MNPFSTHKNPKNIYFFFGEGETYDDKRNACEHFRNIFRIELCDLNTAKKYKKCQAGEIAKHFSLAETANTDFIFEIS